MAHKGNIPWNKGKTYSDEYKEKLSKAKIKNWEDEIYRNMQLCVRKNSEAYQNRKIQQAITLSETYKNHPELAENARNIILSRYTVEERKIKSQNAVNAKRQKYSPQQISEMARKAVLKSRGNQRSPSSIEKMMAKELKENNIEFIQQVAMLEKYKVDFLIEDFLIVEVDGIYWHNLPNIKEKDKIRDENLKNNGFTILRFWENEVKNDITSCINKIKSYISL